VFEGNKEAIRRQIGMAVPPEGAKVIFEAIIKTLEGIDYKSVPPNIE
jgi:DNA (cytosine-5)-methyltransferase 1